MRLIIAATAAMLVLPSAVFAQAGSSSSATADASATVVQPLQVDCDTMHFGQLAPLSSPTYVIMPAQGSPLEDPYDIVVPGTRDFATPGNCHVTGEPGLSYHVSFADSATLSHGNDTMTLSAFTISQEVDGQPYDRLLSSTGSNGFGVGAKLSVGANQAPGLYTGTYLVSVQYN